MKYRIIGDTDANNHSFYLAQYQVKLWFGITWWRSLEHGHADCTWPVEFDTCATAEAAVTKFLRGKIRARTVVAAGEVTGPV